VVERVREAMTGDGRIRLLGFLPEEQLADFYASLDVFVLPSVNPLDAFGIVQVEAMLAGVPVIASDRPGVSVPVRDTGFGALVPAADPVALRAAIATIPQTEFGGAGARARSRYSVAATVDAYETLLAGLAGR
jgi:glycosyltransferase involved in cell wall biosynthesis